MLGCYEDYHTGAIDSQERDYFVISTKKPALESGEKIFFIQIPKTFDFLGRRVYADPIFHILETENRLFLTNLSNDNRPNLVKKFPRPPH